MREIEATGKTIEKAIENGLKELNTTMENVDIKILSEGGMFSKAKVLITMAEAEKAVEKTEEKVEVTEEVVEETTTEEVETEESEVVEETTTNKKAEVNLDEVVAVAEDFLGGLVYMLNLQATIEHNTADKLPEIKLTGDDLGVLIGYRGDTLEAVQNLMNVIVHNKTGFKGKVLLDIENYRNRRVQTLCDLATRIAKQVVKNKKSFKLEPMNSYERRVIHAHLQGFEHVTTHSEGKEPDRHLIIDYVE
jgi:spoIIIJ-associated protein